MKATRKEIVEGRESAVVLRYTTPGTVDEWTGEVIPGETVLLDVTGVVTEMSGDERIITNGIVTEKGDLQIGIDIDLVGSNYEIFKDVGFKSQSYTILAIDAKGIGADIRIEIIARLTT